MKTFLSKKKQEIEQKCRERTLVLTLREANNDPPNQAREDCMKGHGQRTPLVMIVFMAEKRGSVWDLSEAAAMMASGSPSGDEGDGRRVRS